MHRPLRVAHRGGAGLAPENTLAAFRQGLAFQADAVELDLHMSRDGALVVAQAIYVVRFVNRTNDELARFFAAVRYDDFSQSFSIEHLGGSFSELESAFEHVMTRFRDTRSDREVQRRYLETLIDHVPVAIIAVRERTPARAPPSLGQRSASGDGGIGGKAENVLAEAGLDGESQLRAINRWADGGWAAARRAATTAAAT